MIYTVFENQQQQLLFPLNQIKASFELRCGAFTNLERIQKSIDINDEIHLFVRDELKEVIQQLNPGLKVNPKTLSKGTILMIGGITFTAAPIISEVTSNPTPFRRQTNAPGLNVSAPITATR